MTPLDIPLVPIAFMTGLACGLWIAVLCRPRPEKREADPTTEAEWWQNGGTPPEWGE